MEEQEKKQMQEGVYMLARSLLPASVIDDRGLANRVRALSDEQLKHVSERYKEVSLSILRELGFPV